MLFQSISLSGWQQYGQVDIAFHDRLTVLTGANGSGKTTLLRFLARHFGWGFVSLRTPQQTRGRGFRYIAHIFGRKAADNSPTEVGTIAYSNGQRSPIRIPPGDEAAAYNLSIDSPQNVPGFFIPSHRQEFRYQRVEHLPLRPRQWSADAFNTVQNSIRNMYGGSGGPSANYHMKEVLIGLAVFGYGNEAVEADGEARRLYEEFQRILRLILPLELGFQSLAIRDRAEVVLETRSGAFLLDAVSGGIAALIELAWQIFMFVPPERERFAVVIDEPENHLHAAMQRRLMPSFVQAFPVTQFVIATHSPLIVGSVKDSNVYAMRFNEQGRVLGERLDLYDKSGSADEVLREVLGVDVPIPVWAESALNEIVARYVSQPLTVESARRLRVEMNEAGLLRLMPITLAKIADAQT
jgi:hypothetical protein